MLWNYGYTNSSHYVVVGKEEVPEIVITLKILCIGLQLLILSKLNGGAGMMREYPHQGI